MEVSTASGDAVSPNSAPTAYDGTTAMMTMTTTPAASANIGDHVELRLKNTAGTGTDALASYA